MDRNLAHAAKARRPVPGKQGGFTLMETMLAVSVVSAAMIGTLSFGNKVWAGVKITQASSVADQLNSQVLSRFSVAPSFTSLPSTPASTWISDLPMNGNNVQGPWGAVQLQAATVNTAADSWALTFNGVPIPACVQMLVQMSSRYYASGVNGVFTSATDGAAVVPAEAEVLCNASANTVSFVSKPAMSSSGAVVVPAFAPTAASTLPAWTPPPATPALTGAGEPAPMLAGMGGAIPILTQTPGPDLPQVDHHFSDDDPAPTPIDPGTGSAMSTPNTQESPAAPSNTPIGTIDQGQNGSAPIQIIQNGY